MPTQHVVKAGESLPIIAAQYRISDWRKIYDDAANAAFRQKRPDPHVIQEGDELTIPERETRDQDGATSARHRFQKKGSAVWLGITLKNGAGEALAGYKYRLRVEGEILEGTTNADTHPRLHRARRLRDVRDRHREPKPSTCLQSASPLALSKITRFSNVEGVL